MSRFCSDPLYKPYLDKGGKYGIALAQEDVRLPGFTGDYWKAEEIALLFTSVRLLPIHMQDAADDFRDVISG